MPIDPPGSANATRKKQAGLMNTLLALGADITYVFVEDYEEEYANTAYAVSHIALIGPGSFRATVINPIGDKNRHLLVGPWARLILNLEGVDLSVLTPGAQIRLAPKKKEPLPADAPDGIVTATIMHLETGDVSGPSFRVKWKVTEERDAEAVIGLDQILEIL